MPRVGRYLVIKDTETSGKDKDKPNQTSQGRPNTNTTEPPTAPRNAEEPGDPDSDEASKIISKYHRPDSPTSVPSQRTSHGGQREQERRRKREEQRDGRGDNVKFLQWPSYSLTPRGSGHQAKRAAQVTREPRFLHGSVTAESRQARSIQLRGLIRVPRDPFPTLEPRFLHGSTTAEPRQARSIQLRGLIRVPRDPLPSRVPLGSDTARTCEARSIKPRGPIRVVRTVSAVPKPALHGARKVNARTREARSIQLRGLIRVPCTVGAVPKPVGSFQVPSTAGSVNASALSRSTLGSVQTRAFSRSIALARKEPSFLVRGVRRLVNLPPRQIHLPSILLQSRSTRVPVRSLPGSAQARSRQARLIQHRVPVQVSYRRLGSRVLGGLYRSPLWLTPVR
jgi:hypothetical protein